eukprot:GAHX01003139.1.p1 GENE.GAHX01003139.1~~GAHX01003139.1.p1  ORF type:complete len:113 (-),score=9.00 GAHX01003139.1:78-395(-)
MKNRKDKKKDDITSRIEYLLGITLELCVEDFHLFRQLIVTYSLMIKKLSQKGGLKYSKEMNRIFCKNCSIILLRNINCRIVKSRKIKGFSNITCLNCMFLRRVKN